MSKLMNKLKEKMKGDSSSGILPTISTYPPPVFRAMSKTHVILTKP